MSMTRRRVRAHHPKGCLPPQNPSPSHPELGSTHLAELPADSGPRFGTYCGETMSIEWIASIDQDLVSDVQLADGWHTIDVPSFIVSPQDASFSFDETVAHTHTSPRTRVVVGPLSSVLAVAFAS
jgi:hypothetical protein